MSIGIKVQNTKSYIFEEKIAKQIDNFFKNVEDPKYKILNVFKYDESDNKYYSDVCITNPKNNKNVWVEVKLDKYSCFSGSSFKYNDNNWTCTTINEDNTLNLFYLAALNTHGKKFIEFCKDYLGTDDIKLPTDITDDLLNAWKRSGNITDTENETQFITDKIPLEDFGFVISRFYQTAKLEPVYYIQVADDLYIIDPEYNPLNICTKDGTPLKSIAEAYRIGRIQFRVKAMNKNNERYFAITVDVKILSDKEHYDKEYSCSFDTQEKWPIIKDEELRENVQNVENLKLLTNVPEDNIKNILDTQNIENKRYERDQFTKYFGIKETNWVCLMNENECLAIAALANDNPFKGYSFIQEVQTLRKGYGRYLLEEIFQRYGKVSLMANTMAGEDLMNYYMKLNLQEIIVEDSVYGCPAHFFCTKDCDYDKLEAYFIAFYSNEEEESI